MSGYGFGNRTVTLHLLRGVLGFAALGGALFGGSILAAVVLLPAALVLLKGCPTCWTIGLVETIARRSRAARSVAEERLPIA